METQVYSLNGDVIKKIELADAVFSAEVSEGLIYHAIKNELANRRVGTACAKTRSEVAGSGKKPWRQKGTGRARAGHKRSPVWVGGGVVFGPKPRDYSYVLPKKMKRGAYRSLFSKKVGENSFKVVENFSVESGKTKEMAKSLSVLRGDASRVVLVLSSDDAKTKLAGRNLPWLSVFTYDKLLAHDIFYADSVLVQEEAALKLSEFLQK